MQLYILVPLECACIFKQGPFSAASINSGVFRYLVWIILMMVFGG